MFFKKGGSSGVISSRSTTPEGIVKSITIFTKEICAVYNVSGLVISTSLRKYNRVMGGALGVHFFPLLYFLSFPCLVRGGSDKSRRSGHWYHPGSCSYFCRTQLEFFQAFWPFRSKPDEVG